MKLKKILTIITIICTSAVAAGMLAGCQDKPQDGQTDTAENVTQTEDIQDDNSEFLLAFSAESGFYDSGFDLEIICKDKNAEIYYTLDGSIPDKGGSLYSAPIALENRTSEPNDLSAEKGVAGDADYIPQKNVDKANVVRAVAYLPDGTETPVINGTFFIGIDREAKYGGVPIVSLFTDKANLFDYDTGIYVKGKTYDDWIAEDPSRAKLAGWQMTGNYSNKGKDWERPVTVQYFDADGNSAFIQDMGMRIKGGVTRNEMQKSIKLIARAEYGEKSVKYEVIPDNMRSDKSGNVEKYRSFVLRNGGNDCNFAKVRDPYLQMLVYDRRFDTEQFTPCVAFINGEYWGMYSLTEDYSDKYIQYNYGIDDNNVVAVKKGELEEGNDGDMELYYEMYGFITENDMTVSENYEKASEMFDLGSFADYCAFNLYIYNEDSIFRNNNWEMWRVRDADGETPYSDGKWRMMVYDVDYSTGIYTDGKSYSDDNISVIFDENPYVDISAKNYDGRHPAKIFQSLYKNEDFRREFINAMCDIRNINFSNQVTVKVLNEMSEPYKKLVPDTFERFGPEWITMFDPVGFYKNEVSELGQFTLGRYNIFPRKLQNILELEEMSDMKLDVSDGSKGAVKINASGIPITESFKGVYFGEYDITLTAVPESGAKFVRWEYENCTVSSDTDEKITVSFDEDFSIKAIFE